MPPWRWAGTGDGGKKPPDNAEGDKPGFWYLLTGLSALVTAFAPMLVALIEKRKGELSQQPPNGRGEASDTPKTHGAYAWTSLDPQAVLTFWEVVIFLLAALFFAYLAVWFVQVLLMFICAYTLVVALSFVCYAYGVKLLKQTELAVEQSESERRALKERRAHEVRLARLKSRKMRA